MGEVSDMIVNGILCVECGCLVDGEESGYPRKCEDCEEESFV